MNKSEYLSKIGGEYDTGFADGQADKQRDILGSSYDSGFDSYFMPTSLRPVVEATAGRGWDDGAAGATANNTPQLDVSFANSAVLEDLKRVYDDAYGTAKQFATGGGGSGTSSDKSYTGWVVGGLALLAAGVGIYAVAKSAKKSGSGTVGARPALASSNPAREAYAWPGGYPMYYQDEHDNVLCPKCAEDVEEELASDVNWEDPDLYCDECGERIESAYSEDLVELDESEDDDTGRGAIQKLEKAAKAEAANFGGEVPATIGAGKGTGFTIETSDIIRGTYTLYRPAEVLGDLDDTGYLIPGSVDTKTFYQTNNDVTQAQYKVPGYKYPVVVWWDNKTGKRIA